MSLTPKKPPLESHKKLNARHHRQTKSYLKAYWPYIPVAAIIGAGVIIAHETRPINSNNLILTNYTYYDIIESSIGLFALAVFLLRHAFAWKKVFIEGEEFVTKHPLLDIGLVSIAVISLLLAHQFPG